MVCEVWIQDLVADYNASMYSGSTTRRGHKVTISATVCKVSIPLKKFGSPTGTLYARIRKVSDDSIIETSTDTVDVSTLTTDFVWYDFTFDSAVDEEVRVIVEFTEGDLDNQVYTGWHLSDTMVGVACRYEAGYTDYSGYELTCKIWTETAGGLSIPVAMHHYNRINKIIRG